MNKLQMMIWELKNINELKAKGVSNYNHSVSVVGLSSSLNTEFLEMALKQLALELGYNPHKCSELMNQEAPMADDLSDEEKALYRKVA